MATVNLTITVKRVWFLEPLYWMWLLTCKYGDIETDTTKVAKLFYKWRVGNSGKWRDF